MAGIYIHVPFCKSRCIYCSFYSTTQLSLSQRYVDALCKELSLRSDELNGEDVTTIYLGGGTPSQLTVGQIAQILHSVSSAFYDCLHIEELTVECNPDDVNISFAYALRELGVNRISMGVQSFSDARLSFLRRRHTAAEAAEAFNTLRKAGFSNISIDLMYGFPGETMEEWQHDIDAALSLSPEHISAYSLSYEEATPLYRMLTHGDVTEVDEELSRAMYYRLKDALKQSGYEHYEISNFAKMGDRQLRSLHNSGYWNLTPYLGLGAAAHSYVGGKRRWNVYDVKSYIEGIETKHPDYQEEALDSSTIYNDTIMLRLRTREGLLLEALPSELRKYCEQTAEQFLHSGLLKCSSGHLSLTREGLFVSDMIISELMIV